MTRLRIVADALTLPGRQTEAMGELFGTAGDASAAWLLLAMIESTLPSLARVRQFQRDCTLDGPALTVRRVERAALARVRRPPVLVTGTFLVLQDAAPSPSEGDRWSEARRAGVVIARWKRAGVLAVNGQRVVPWGASLVVMGVQRNLQSALALAAAARLSRSTSVAVGDGLDGLAPESSDPSGYASHLAALQQFQRVCGTDERSAAQMTAWASMLPGAGITPPMVSTVLPPSDADPAGWAAYVAALAAL